MGFPIARVAGRAAFIGAIIAGGLLAAGIAQAQAQTLPSVASQTNTAAGAAPSADDAQPTSADRQAELIAATGGPVSAQYLVVAAPERPEVDARADDVEDAAPNSANALNAAEAAGGSAAQASEAAGVAPR